MLEVAGKQDPTMLTAPLSIVLMSTSPLERRCKQGTRKFELWCCNQVQVQIHSQSSCGAVDIAVWLFLHMLVGTGQIPLRSDAHQI